MIRKINRQGTKSLVYTKIKRKKNQSEIDSSYSRSNYSK